MLYPHLATRLKRELPPAAPLPSALQTLGCRLRPHDYFSYARRRYGPQFTIYPTAMPPLVVLSDPAEIKTMLAAPPSVLHPGAGAHLTAAFYGPHSFILNDENAHRAGRAAIMPIFRRANIEQPQHRQMVTDLVKREIESWPHDTAFQAHSRLRALTLRVILHTVFGGETPKVTALHKRILELPEATASLVVQQPLLRHLPGWHRTWRLFQEQRRDVYQLARAILTERRETHDQRHDLLGTLLLAHNEHDTPLSEHEILDHLVSLTIAGHETTAAQLAWALQLLAHNMQIQRRLIEEIDAGNETYLTATIQETLRHRCVFLFAMPRMVAQPIQLGDWTYKPPVHLLAAIHLVHHDPTNFTDPDAFEPQRFLDSSPPSNTWLPWGGGDRTCPGKHLALQEMQIVLQTILANREVRPTTPEIERPRWRNAITVPHAGAQIKLSGHRTTTPKPSAAQDDDAHSMPPHRQAAPTRIQLSSKFVPPERNSFQRNKSLDMAHTNPQHSAVDATGSNNKDET